MNILQLIRRMKLIAPLTGIILLRYIRHKDNYVCDRILQSLDHCLEGNLGQITATAPGIL